VQEIVSVRNRARFVPPSSLDPIVARARLDDHYATATGQILRVLAPPGYGKSTQIARWVADEPRHVGWVDLERVDNDPFVLAAALARALTHTGRQLSDAQWDAAFDGGGVVGNLAPGLGALVDQIEWPFVLVLDDVHNVDAIESLAVLDALAAHLPPSSTLVLSGRSHPDQRSLARRRLHPGIVDVTVHHLALDTAETDELLTSMGVRLELDPLTQLCDRFEGWAAGIRLAGLALQGEGEPAWLSPGHVGDATYVVDYLRSEWTGQLSPEDKRFLCEAACLDRFTGEMCDEILGRTQSLATLRHMHREELLLLPLDQRDEWFRMHPLLTRWLSADLEATDRHRWREIHHAAATWWVQHGDVDLAIEHTLLTGDIAAAEALVTEHGFTYLARGLVSTVRRWLAAFPNDFARTSGGLCAITALDALYLGDGARAWQWYEHLRRVLAGSGSSPSSTRLHQRAAVLRITLAREPAGDLLALAETVSAELADDVWTALALYATGGVRFLAGDDRAVGALEEAAFVAEIAGMWVHQANCTSATGIIADLTGDRDAAVAAGQRAADLLTRWPSELPPTTAITDALAALNAARAGQRDLAASRLAAGRQRLLALHSVGPWFNALCGLAFTRAALLIDDRTTSRTLLRELEHALRLEAPDNGAATHVEALRTSIEAARQLPSDPAWALTDAELKVLQHLPTNLTLADIATRLFVSRNTVKSHVAAIYRKLGTTSRSDAVDLARQTGLVEDGSAESRD
jgi:LuxR family transcriptional regulator, maltose regulon positive regulatory protein